MPVKLITSRRAPPLKSARAAPKSARTASDMPPLAPGEAVEIFRAPDRAAEGLLFHAIASRSVVNEHNYCLLARGCEVRFPIPVLWRHRNRGRVGEVVEVRKYGDRIEVIGRIDDNEVGKIAWLEITTGKLAAVSGAAGPNPRVQGVINETRYYDRWTLKEVSLCPRGACPGAVITKSWTTRRNR